MTSGEVYFHEEKFEDLQVPTSQHLSSMWANGKYDIITSPLVGL